MLLEGRRAPFSGVRGQKIYYGMYFSNRCVLANWSHSCCRDTLPVIPGVLMNTLPLRFSFPFGSTERPRLKMDRHFFDFPDNFLLMEKNRRPHESEICVTAAGRCVRAAVCSLAVDVDDCVVEGGAAGVWQAVLPLTLAVHRMVWAQGAGLGLFQAHQLHRSTLASDGKRGVLLCTHQPGT